MHNVFTSPKICASTTFGNLKLQVEPSPQYLHVHFNESLNSDKHDRQDPFSIFDVCWNDGCQSPMLPIEPYSVSVACPLGFVPALQP